MMFAFFEDGGSFKAEKIFSEADSTLQVESASGKRSKIKRANVLFTFNDINPQALLEQANQQAAEIDVEFLWEMSPSDEFDVEQMALDYFGHTPTSLEKTTLLLCLHAHPVYFHRKGKGHYRAAPEDILKAAILALEKKQKQAEQLEHWTSLMVNGETPTEINSVLPSFLIRPDKNTLAWKAFEKAMSETGLSVAQLLLKLNVFPHALALHRYAFIEQYFPKGLAAPIVPITALPENLPKAAAPAYSIDSEDTTEIDDAFSLQAESPEIYVIGIHIAAPALVVTRGTESDKIARSRMSSVYSPGDKITMQSNELVSLFSLDEGRYTPCLSLYVRANINTGEILSHESRVEQVYIQENIRSNRLIGQITLDALESQEAPLPYAELFRPMWQFAKHLRQARDEMRGKPENLNRVEYLFNLEGPSDNPDSRIVLTPRLRSDPLDLLVQEYMILANRLWAGLLEECGLPGIFRTQQGGRVRQTTFPQPHEGIGVNRYGWSTSPLRRYVDLVNQGQIIAAIEHGVSARLVAPYKPKDPDLFAIISEFETKHAAWSSFQNQMERYWCLRWFEQNRIKTVEATIIRDNLVRFNQAPFITPVNGMPELNPGDQVQLELYQANLLDLTLECRYVAQLSSEPTL